MCILVLVSLIMFRLIFSCVFYEFRRVPSFSLVSCSLKSYSMSFRRVPVSVISSSCVSEFPPPATICIYQCICNEGLKSIVDGGISASSAVHRVLIDLFDGWSGTSTGIGWRTTWSTTGHTAWHTSWSSTLALVQLAHDGRAHLLQFFLLVLVFVLGGT